MFLYAISFTFPLFLCSKRTIYRATVRPLMAKDRWIMFARRCNRRSFVISRFFSVYFSVTSRWYILYYIILCLLLFFILKTANPSNVQTRRLYTYAVNQSTLSSTTKSICFLQIHCILQREPEPTLKESLDKYLSSPRLPRQQNCDWVKPGVKRKSKKPIWRPMAANLKLERSWWPFWGKVLHTSTPKEHSTDV